MFTHLHTHSAFSLLEGAFSIPQLLFRLQELQISAIALTDTNGLYGAVTFYKFAKQLGIKPIIGSCLQSQDGEAVLLARDLEGFSQISQIVTARHLVENFSLRKDLKKLAYTSDPHFFILSRDESLLQDLATCWDHRFLFAEILRNSQSGNATQIQRLRDLASHLHIGLVATNDVHFLYPQDLFLHRMMTAIRLQSNIQAKLPLSASESWLKSPAEMTELFSDIPDAVQNTIRIAEECNLELELGKFTFPQFSVPDGSNSWNFLESLCREGMDRRFPNGCSEAENRLEREMAVIRRLGFIDYFLVVWDILRLAQERGIIGSDAVRQQIASFPTSWKSPTSIRFVTICILNAS